MADQNGEETVPCQFCDTPTRMTGTKMCNNCWEIQGRISNTTDGRLVLAKIIQSKINPLGIPDLIELLKNSI